jgi:hypothetical protein
VMRQDCMELPLPILTESFACYRPGNRDSHSSE